jgi:hypothetical protein
MRRRRVKSKISGLESEVTRLRRIIATAPERPNDWLRRLAGAFANDPAFEEAMRLGRKWREADRPKERRVRAARRKPKK